MAIGIAEPSIQSLFIEMQFDGQPLATGTGFVIISRRGPMLITNRHNLTGRHQKTGDPLSSTGGLPNRVKIWHNSRGLLGHWVEKTEDLYDEGNPRWIEHPVLGSRADVAAIPLSETFGVDFYPYDLNSSNVDVKLGPAEIVSVVGFPFGLRSNGSVAIWGTGFVASEPDLDYDNLPTFLIDCRARQGQSGSAVIAYRSGGMVSTSDGVAINDGPICRFLGIYSGRIHSESDLGLVWKPRTIAAILESL